MWGTKFFLSVFACTLLLHHPTLLKIINTCLLEVCCWLSGNIFIFIINKSLAQCTKWKRYEVVLTFFVPNVVWGGWNSLWPFKITVKPINRWIWWSKENCFARSVCSYAFLFAFTIQAYSIRVLHRFSSLFGAIFSCFSYDGISCSSLKVFASLRVLCCSIFMYMRSQWFYHWTCMKFV